MPMPMVVLNKYLISRVITETLQREKWSKNPELPPEFEYEKPLYFWPVTLASMHREA